MQVSNNEIKVYVCGTTVKISDTTLEGRVTSIAIRFDSISYEISYWAGSDLKTVWLTDAQFYVPSLEDGTRPFEKRLIGFNS